MMAAVFNVLIGVALVIGLFFNTLGVFGILRFPDIYTRLHADTKATTFGTIFIGLAVVIWAIREAIQDVAAGAWVNLILHILVAVVVLCVTNATGGHAIARAAWRAGHRPARAVVDTLSADADAGTLYVPDAPPAAPAPSAPAAPAEAAEAAPEEAPAEPEPAAPEASAESETAAPAEESPAVEEQQLPVEPETPANPEVPVAEPVAEPAPAPAAEPAAAPADAPASADAPVPAEAPADSPADSSPVPAAPAPVSPEGAQP